MIARVSALELKKEQMVKLPVIVYRRDGKREVVDTAIRSIEDNSCLSNQLKLHSYLRIR